MQEDNFEGQTAQMDGLSVEDLFMGSQETYAQAQQRALEENRSFAKTDYFRMDKFGVYRLRVLPIAPNTDGTAARPGYEFPVHQLLLEIERPAAGAGKTSSMYVTVTRATDAGFSVDLIDTYRKAAVEAAKAQGDDDLAEKIGGGSFGGGLKYGYGHAMYVYDLNERAKGLMLLTLSHSQFKDLDERKFKLWQKKLAKNPSYPCPISSVYNAYPVEIEKKKNGAKTEYTIGIDNESDTDVLSRDELSALLAAPRIPEVVYRYSRYHFEACIEFLKQCDVKYGLNLMSDELMQQTIEQLRNELPKDDTSSFSFDKRSKENKENAASESSALTLDGLFDRYEELEAKNLGDKTEEGQELRAMIRTYIEQEKLPVRVTRSTTNRDLLEQIEAALQGPVPGAPEPQEESVEQDRPRRR
jgi:hypothetical protein